MVAPGRAKLANHYPNLFLTLSIYPCTAELTHRRKDAQSERESACLRGNIVFEELTGSSLVSRSRLGMSSCHTFVSIKITSGFVQVRITTLIPHPGFQVTTTVGDLKKISQPNSFLGASGQSPHSRNALRQARVEIAYNPGAPCSRYTNFFPVTAG